MTGFALTPEALGTAAADIGAAHGSLVAAVGDVAAEVTSLVGDGWRGAAATAFCEGFDEWRRGAALVLEGLADSGAAVAASRQAYLGSDDRSDELLSRFAARLGGAA